ncbi:MAG: winged helix-turn-helix domain-containing protein [Euryarchaeota archaeon]|nr:winged helix-turn-helix domain-containing protein [Euryarchaeota archaeon]
MGVNWNGRSPNEWLERDITDVKLYNFMPSEEIIIDKDSIDVLSSDTRVTLLKSLDSSGRMTATRLSDEWNLSKSTVHEHLTRLAEAGFVKKDDSRKWVYWELTDRGRGVLHPHRETRILFLLASGALAMVGGIVEMCRAVKDMFAPAAPPMKGISIPAEMHLVTGIVLVFVGVLLLYLGFRAKWKR